MADRIERVMSTSTPFILADCLHCEWQNTARNALSTGALHHDATGHAVRIEVHRLVVYGNPSAAMPGQQVADFAELRTEEAPCPD